MIKSRWLLCTSLVCYIGSWFLPALYFQSSKAIYTHELPAMLETWNGLICFLLGFLGIKRGHFEVFANLCYLVAVIYVFKKNWKNAKKFSLISLFFGLETLLLFWFPPLQYDFEGEHTTSIFLGFGPGFYIWMLSMLLVFILAFSALKQAKADEKQESPEV